jgi:hypothetical protein
LTAYTDATKIAAYLGVTLTSPQQTQAGIAAQAASDWIDEYKGRSWQAASPVTGEIQAVVGDSIWLDNRPIATVTSVETRQPVVGASWTTLAVGQYEIADATSGQLRLTGWGNYEARVSYTHTATAPPSQIALAATIIAASLLGPTLRPNTAGLDSVSVGQNDVAVKFSVDYGSVPSEAMALLGGRAIVIA